MTASGAEPRGGWPERIEPDGSHSEEPPVFEEAPANVLTPMGMVDAHGAFARGLGPRVVKIVVFGTLLLLILQSATGLLR